MGKVWTRKDAFLWEEFRTVKSLAGGTAANASAKVAPGHVKKNSENRRGT